MDKKLLKDFLVAPVYDFMDWRARGGELVRAYLGVTGDERGSHVRLARKIGMTEQTLSNMLAGRRYLTKLAMKKMYMLVKAVKLDG